MARLLGTPVISEEAKARCGYKVSEENLNNIARQKLLQQSTSKMTPTVRPGPREISTEVSKKVTTGQSADPGNKSLDLIENSLSCPEGFLRV